MVTRKSFAINYIYSYKQYGIYDNIFTPQELTVLDNNYGAHRITALVSVGRLNQPFKYSDKLKH